MATRGLAQLLAPSWYHPPKAKRKPRNNPKSIYDVGDKFKIQSELDGLTFEATYADGAPLVIEGYAGWQVVPRPKEVGLVEWQGRNPMAIEIPFVIDYWMSGIDNPGIHCENKVKRLERLCGIGSHRQPPICIVDGGGVIPHDYTIYRAGRWVIENVTWDRAIELRHNTTGRRLRCGGTIVIRQFVTNREVLRKITSKDRAKRPRVYVVKRGDNLSKIANYFYRDPSKWRIIADANKIRDRRKLKIGQRIKVPRL